MIFIEPDSRVTPAQLTNIEMLFLIGNKGQIPFKTIPHLDGMTSSAVSAKGLE
jgi:hypothetical protein